jgi:hypothetical protein
MSITYRIDHQRRLVIAHGKDLFTQDDIFAYQREVWTRPDVQGYDEIVDMTGVDEIELPDAPSLSVRQLAIEAAEADHPDQPSKFAIVAPDRLAYGLGRMYQVYRQLEARSTKEVGVFKTHSEAWAFLGIDQPPGESAAPGDGGSAGR